jgi:hypothetical protein
LEIKAFISPAPLNQQAVFDRFHTSYSVLVHRSASKSTLARVVTTESDIHEQAKAAKQNKKTQNRSTVVLDTRLGNQHSRPFF